MLLRARLWLRGLQLLCAYASVGLRAFTLKLFPPSHMCRSTCFADNKISMNFSSTDFSGAREGDAAVKV